MLRIAFPHPPVYSVACPQLPCLLALPAVPALTDVCIRAKLLSGREVMSIEQKNNFMLDSWMVVLTIKQKKHFKTNLAPPPHPTTLPPPRALVAARAIPRAQILSGRGEICRILLLAPFCVDRTNSNLC